jgi:hypothetical protein
VTGPDPELELPAAPYLMAPLGPLTPGPLTPLGPHGAGPGDEVGPGDDRPFAVAGPGACVTGGTTRGADLVRVHPLRLATGPRIDGATVLGSTITPLGLERRLRVGAATVVERVVAPRDGSYCLFEWEAAGAAAELALEWRVVLAPERAEAGDAASERAPLRWRAGPAGLVAVGSGASRRGVFVLGGQPFDLAVDDDAADGSGLRVTARAALPAGASIRLAMLGGAGAVEPGLTRALRSASRGRAVVLARRGAVDRLARETVSLESPDPALDAALARARLDLEDRVVDHPGEGRWLVPGYGSEPLSAATAAGMGGALDCLLTGQVQAARDVLAFVGRHQDEGGGVPAEWGGPGPSDGAVRESWLYLLLAGRYLAWTGDVPLVQAEWARVLRAVEYLREADPPGARAADPVRGAALRELARAAESLGDEVNAARLREWRAAPDADRGALPGGNEAVARLRALLAPEPDATRGRLILRPRPPAGWGSFTVRALTVGDAAITLAYEGRAGAHRFRVRQERGAAPLRLILEPELAGRFVAARVDGVAAELEPVSVPWGGGGGGGGGGEDRVRVPVQMMVDHERVLEVELESSG